MLTWTDASEKGGQEGTLSLSNALRESALVPLCTLFPSVNRHLDLPFIKGTVGNIHPLGVTPALRADEDSPRNTCWVLPSILSVSSHVPVSLPRLPS
jgi:hypothetical protein